MKQFNFDRFRMFPELFKLTTLVSGTFITFLFYPYLQLTTILVMLSIGAAFDQPPGTSKSSENFVFFSFSLHLDNRRSGHYLRLPLRYGGWL